MNVPFSRPYTNQKTLDYVQDAIATSHLEGDGKYTKKCQQLMAEKFNSPHVFLTTSCTHALEMAALLLDIKPGDEVIMPSFTFVSTANAFVLRGAKPIFIDIRPDTLNMDETLIEAAITDKTKAIVPVHYAGVACEMDKIMEIAKKHKIAVVEDAAQGVNAQYKGEFLGSIGDIGCYSFHGTKNYTCGEGGAILMRDTHREKAEIIREKGTDRSKFFRGEIDKYTWRDVGSSYLPSDLLAAYLYAQLDMMDDISLKRKAAFDFYQEQLKPLQDAGKLQLPVIPDHCVSNYHLYHILTATPEQRSLFLKYLKEQGIYAVFHYVPLHLSAMGQSFGYKEGDLPVTEKAAASLIRLPLFTDVKREEQEYVIKTVKAYFASD